MAGIFGFNGDRNKQNNNSQPPPPPKGGPPPRPPPRRSGGTTFIRPPPKGYPPPPPKNQQNKASARKPPPPPPPPRAVESLEEKVAKEIAASKDEVENADETKESTESATETKSDKLPATNATSSEAEVESQGGSFVLEQPEQPKQQPPSPPSGQWEGQPQAPNNNYDNQGWQNNGMQYQDYNQYDQGYGMDQQQQYDANVYYLQEELTDSLNREASLVAQLNNLTEATIAMEEREDLHKHQLDVLTARVVDVEAESANDRTLLVEYENNCTVMSNQILSMQDDLEEWEERCKEWNQQNEESKDKLEELKQAIKEKQREAEDLAIAMEDLRMTEQRRQQYGDKAKAKSGGLFSWMLSWIGLGGSSKKSQRYDDEVREDAFEMAKSTLLRALQSERTNVHELESAVASLQQNNSAISEMVESRDNIIDELNNRIAVFEADKVVLKAALRQLQKEMKEEEPKTQKLIDELAEAEQEIEKIKADFESIIETHQEELSNLQMAMSNKEKTITDAESNLTAIGTYVDKLEDRLTSFAMTRRDMEEREKKCKEIEKKAEESETKRKSAESELEELKKQEEELKKLLEELAVDRTALQKENRRLYTEQEFRIGEQEKLTSEHESLQTQSTSIREELEEYKARCEALAPDLEAAQECNLELERQIESLSGSQKQLNTLQIENAVVVEENEKLKDEISATTEEKNQLQAELQQLVKEIEERKEAERLAKAEKLAKEEAEKLLPPPPPPKVTRRDVPLRSIRKTLSKATGLHGVLTPPSNSNASPTQGRPRKGPPPKKVPEESEL